MKIVANLFPNGKPFALTMSYDDGREFDRRLVSIFNTYGIRGTFHLNGGRLGKENFVTAAEIPELYKNHEVSSHMLTHPYPETCPDTTTMYECYEDRRILEAACGYTVRGMSYPYGNYTQQNIDLLRACGMRYSRTTLSTNDFRLPEDFMRWHPTTHHKGDLIGLYDRMLTAKEYQYRHQTLYIWGHSYEFNNDNNWEVIERFCDHAGGNDKVWYATNIELYDYKTASKELYIGVDGRTVFNPSRLSVWVTADGDAVEIKPGENRL